MSSIVRLGQLAVEMGLLTRSQLDQALAIQQAFRPVKSLGGILRDGGYLSDEQIRRLLREQERRLARETGVPAEVARRTQLGELAAQEGFLSREDLNRLLCEQAQNAEAGVRRPIGRVLVEKGVLSQTNLDHLSRRQRRMRRIARTRRDVRTSYLAFTGIAAACVLGAVGFLSSVGSKPVSEAGRRPQPSSRVAESRPASVPAPAESSLPPVSRADAGSPEAPSESAMDAGGPGSRSENAPEIAAETWSAEVQALRPAESPASSSPAEAVPEAPPAHASKEETPVAPPSPVVDPEERQLAQKVVEDGPVAAAAAESLSKRAIRDPKALDLLLLRAQDAFNAPPESRLRALAAAAGTKSDEVKAFLVERAGEEPDAAVHLRVVRMLQALWPDRTTLCFLINVLKVDGDENLRRAVLDEVVAGQAKDVYVQDVLAELIEDESAPAGLRIRAVELLSGPGKARKEVRQIWARQAVYGKPVPVAKACVSALEGAGREEYAKLIQAEKQAGLPDRRGVAKVAGSPPVDSAVASRYVPALLFWKREDKKPDRIVIHTVEGTKNGTISWFKNPQSRVSAHYLVGFDGEVIQNVREADAAQHLWWQPWNQTSFGIEHEGYAAKNEWREAQYRASAALVRDLCRRYRIPVDADHIVSHAALNPKERSDPGPYFDWNYYLALVRGEKDAKRSFLAPSIQLPPDVERRRRIRTLGWRLQASDRAKRYGEANDAATALLDLAPDADLVAYARGRQEAYRKDAGIARQIVRHEDLKLAEGCREFVKTFLAWGQVKTARRCVDAQLDRVTTEEARKRLRAQIADIEAVKREIDRKGYFEIDPTLVNNWK